MRGVLGVVLAVAVVAAGFACGGDNTQKGPSLTLRTSTRVLSDDEAATLTVTAVDENGQPGTGTVTLSAPAGSFDGGPTSISLDLTNGSATTTWACPAGTEGCTGTLRISADWNGIPAATSITVGGRDVTDASVPDGGTDGGTSDGGTALTLAVSRSPIFASVGDSSTITATLSSPSGGPIANEPISFTATLGGFAEYPLPDGSRPPPQKTFTANTDDNGQARVTFLDDGISGTASLTALHEPTGATATTTVEISQVQQIVWVSTKCSGASCSIMGIQNSGFNEVANVNFKVTDVTGKPVPGVLVHFEIPTPPTGTTVGPGSPAQALTDEMGIATANVTAGPTRGAFTVRAWVVEGEIETQSPTIGIRGAKPSNQGFAFSCRQVNVPAYISPTPPAEYLITCDFRLVDRSNNPVGTGTNVYFLTEAGSIPTAVASQAFNPMGDNSKEGTGSVTFSTRGGTFPPADVPPLPAEPGQFPNPRTAEPSWQDGALVRNPRDGLVTIIAYVRGEEYFVDSNNNGQYDPGEKFIDQGEAFIDTNDNGVYDPGEPAPIDDSPANGEWDPPNGVYDADKTIWAETHVLLTGRPVAQNSRIEPSPFTLPCPDGVAKGGYIDLTAYFGDINRNRPVAAGTSFSMKHTASKGTAAWQSGGILDDYGFGISRILVDSTLKRSCETKTAGVCDNIDPLPGTECTATTERCEWKTLFYVSGTTPTWGDGYVGWGRVSGAPLADTKSCENDSVTVSATVQGVKLDVTAGGAIQ
ncbi:MAG: hypothetical protein IRZ16_06905 [Myxococcaceae bacterium]|nr:hypothetical protein [Myxococcaceae bacterium]